MCQCLSQLRRGSRRRRRASGRSGPSLSEGNNWQFAGSVDGAEAAATIYTLVESARASGVDSLAYLERVIDRLGECSAGDIGQLTPWAMAAELPAHRVRSDG